MPVYLDLLILLNFIVDLLLLVAANRLSGHPYGVIRSAAAAAVGGIYGGACLLPGLSFLAGTLWRVASLAMIAGMAYGFRRTSARRCAVFVLLSLALGGVASGLQKGGFWSLVLGAGGVCMLCLFGIRGKLGMEYVDVEVRTEGGCVRFDALRDTGNTLTDPLTGQQILVVSASIAHRLTGATVQELADPVGMAERPGTRLIPFHAVGNSDGLLAARRFEDVTIGGRKGSCLIAFAPNELGRGRPYEALTGGAV